MSDSIESRGAAQLAVEAFSPNGNGSHEVAGQLVLPVEFPVPTVNGNGAATIEQLTFAQRMAERGSERVSRSWAAQVGNWVTNAFHVSVGVGGVTCDAVKRTPALLGATVKSIPDATVVALGPLDQLNARVGKVNADFWTSLSLGNVSHDIGQSTERQAAANVLSGGVLKGVLAYFARRSTKSLFSTRGEHLANLNHSAGWATSAEGIKRDTASRKARIAGRYSLALS